MRKLAAPLFLVVVVSIVLIALFQADLTPVLANQEGATVDSYIKLLLVISAVIFALCMVLLLYSLVAFRRREGDPEDAEPVEGSVPLEIAWTIVPLIIVLSLGFYGAGSLLEVTRAPADGNALEVDVTGFQWSWSFEYPEQGITSSELVLPVDRPVYFRLHSADVIHSFFIPEFRIKMDNIPGKVNEMRITPTRIGTYKVRCAELCGTAHAYMLADVRVVTQEEFDAWVQQKQEEAAAGPQLSEEAQLGQQLASEMGCLGCHSTDGSQMTGPTWKGLFNSERTLTDGSTVVADEEYLHTAIVNPSAQVPEGFPDNVMPKTFGNTLSEEEIQAIIEYIKALQ